MGANQEDNMDENNTKAEDERKASELAEMLANACVGYSYKCISHAISILEHRICRESIFTGEGVYQADEK